MSEIEPRAAKWSLRFDDDSGDRLTVSFDTTARYFNDTVRINQNESDSSRVNVNFADLRWLASRLNDAADILARSALNQDGRSHVD